jgi:hypothetical protein
VFLDARAWELGICFSYIRRPSYKPLADTSSKVTGTIERRHDGREHVESRKTKNIVKPATYDGKGPWLDYKSAL